MLLMKLNDPYARCKKTSFIQRKSHILKNNPMTVLCIFYFPKYHAPNQIMPFYSD